MTQIPTRLTPCGMQLLLVMCLCFSVSIGTMPLNAVNITVYHLNELSSFIDGGAPVNMNTATAAGDVVFDLMESYLYPLACPDGPATHGGPCQNQEVAANNLVTTKLTLSVSPHFGHYAYCNVGVNGTDGHGHPCIDGEYCCFAGEPNSVGFENVSAMASPSRWAECKEGASEYTCLLYRVVFKQTPGNWAYWYSTENRSMCPPTAAGHSDDISCGGNPQPTVLTFDPRDTNISHVNTSSPDECCSQCNSAQQTNCTAWNFESATGECSMTTLPPVAVAAAPSGTFSSAPLCAWQLAGVDKVVNASCHYKYFEDQIELASTPADKACFTACGGVPGVSRNTSDPCWVTCFFNAVMGPNATQPAGSIGGLNWDQIVEWWETPLFDNFTACRDIRPST